MTHFRAFSDFAPTYICQPVGLPVWGTLNTRIMQAQPAQQPFVETLAALLQDELDRRRTSQTERCYKRSGLDERLTLVDFDWQFNPKLPPAACFELLPPQFIAEGSNALIVGKPGTGTLQHVERRWCRQCASSRLIRFPQLCNFSFNACNAALQALLDIVFPNAHHRPAFGPQCRCMPAVPSHVSRDLFPPVGGELSAPALEFPAVPKVAVHEDRQFDFREDDVGLACEPRSIYTEAVSASMELPANRKLDFGVPAANARHGHAPLLDRHVVGHGGEPAARTASCGGAASPPLVRRPSERGGQLHSHRSTRTIRMRTAVEGAFAPPGSTAAG